jgi:hypothetical protein
VGSSAVARTSSTPLYFVTPRLALALGRGAAGDVADPDELFVPKAGGERAKVIGDLLGEFAGRDEDKGASGMEGRVGAGELRLCGEDGVDEGDAVSEGLA